MQDGCTRDKKVCHGRLARPCVFVLGLTALMVCTAPASGPAAPPIETPVGGANSPKPSPPPKPVIETGELVAGTFSVRVPTGSYTAPAGGAPTYSVPGPIVAFKGPDGVWRGHGYLETYPRLVEFEGTLDKAIATLKYTFEDGKSYEVRLTARDGAILMDETSNLGPRNLYVFDAYYGDWLPSAGFALDAAGKNHAFLYLPCYYDKSEVTILPAAGHPARQVAVLGPGPAGVAVLSPAADKKDIAAFWCRAPASWKGADTMGLQLWQRRQLPGDPASRHFLGPETKSDSTPNPRTAGLLGPSLYEGHVTVEFALGVGTRQLIFAVAAKGATRETLPEAIKKVVQANGK
jgi:hypothetical protein